MDTRGAGICGFLNPLTDFDHLEIFLADTTLRAHKIRRHVFPQGPWSDSVLFESFRLIVNPATYDALPLAHEVLGGLKRVRKCMRDMSLT